MLQCTDHGVVVNKIPLLRLFREFLRQPDNNELQNLVKQFQDISQC